MRSRSSPARSDRLAGELAGLRHALATRAEIDQAKGALRAVSGVSSDEAFALLSQRSQNTNHKLGEVARDVLAELDDPSARTTLRQLAKPWFEPAVPSSGLPGGPGASGTRPSSPFARSTSCVRCSVRSPTGWVPSLLRSHWRTARFRSPAPCHSPACQQTGLNGTHDR